MHLERTIRIINKKGTTSYKAGIFTNVTEGFHLLFLEGILFCGIIY